jgi:hypothetical protein
MKSPYDVRGIKRLAYPYQVVMGENIIIVSSVIYMCTIKHLSKYVDVSSNISYITHYISAYLIQV